jgi:hypothetical protein
MQATVIGSAAVRKQVERVVSCPLFASSDSLSRLLRYLVEHSIDRPERPLKEHQIATEVFGRPQDFDPRLDAIVRVQLGRLRTRLARYYAGPGQHDPMLIEIPKGVHIVRFTVSEPLPAAPVTAAAPVRPPALWRGRLPAWLVPLLALMALALAVVSLAWDGRRAASSEVSLQAPEPALMEFWAPFLAGGPDPLIVFSNAEFVGRPETGMRYFDPKHDTSAAILDHYTGVGEVVAASELTRTLARLGRGVRMKRGRLLTLDDVKTNSVVFVGSPAENLTLRELPSARDFSFERLQDTPLQLTIVNRRPLTGEPTRYYASAQVPITEDYALITYGAGLTTGRSILTLAGTTTLGTQAAAEFVCRASELQQLLRRLPAEKRGSFEALLKVRVVKGVPVQSDLVSVHPI